VKRRTKWLVPTSLLAAVVLLLFALGLNRQNEPHYFTAKLERGEIRDVVEATGTINAVVTVLVGSQVSGTIAKLHADFNSRVHKGDLLAVIDPALFQGALLQATADLENAGANLVAAEANLEKAKALLVQGKADHERTVGLAQQGIASPQQLDQTKATYESAVATVGAARASVTQARAQVSQKTAAVSVAQTNLNYTVIRSPIDGTVVARNVDIGQTVAASLQAPTIFTIAQDLTKMQVYAKTDESDVGGIELGRAVVFKVDAFPKETFHGVVSQVRMNATVVQNVVTYDTIVDFDNRDLKLFPGMTAYVTIPIATAANALKVPNAALRYKPPLSLEELRALYLRYGIEEGPEAPNPVEAAATAQPRGAAGDRPARARPSGGSAVIWRMHADRRTEPVKIALGITDHSYTELTGLIHGELREGDEIVTSSVGGKTPEGPSVLGGPRR
jgi:HlyD family secretion protein